jgi:hypothetical protein
MRLYEFTDPRADFSYLHTHRARRCKHYRVNGGNLQQGRRQASIATLHLFVLKLLLFMSLTDRK